MPIAHALTHTRLRYVAHIPNLPKPDPKRTWSLRYGPSNPRGTAAESPHGAPTRKSPLLLWRIREEERGSWVVWMLASICRLSVRSFVNGITRSALVESESSFFSFFRVYLHLALLFLLCGVQSTMYTVGNFYVIAAAAVIGGGLFGFDISSMSAIIGVQQHKPCR